MKIEYKKITCAIVALLLIIFVGVVPLDTSNDSIVLAEEVTTENQNMNEQEISRSILDADYILSSQTYNNTPKSQFKRPPSYGVYDFSDVQVGDIIYESNFMNPVGHAAIISDISHSSEYGTYIQTIEAVPGGVQYGFLDDIRMVDFEDYIIRPYLASAEQKQDAVDFCKMQLGKGYWYDADDNNTDVSPNESTWYCSELLYAAYYNAGCPIFMGALEDGHTLPMHFYATWQTIDILDYEEIFLKLSIDTSGPKWTINVNNPTQNPVYVTYNSKMCFKNDAINWTNLHDTESFTLGSTDTQPIKISTNWFATHIALSWVYSNAYTNVRIVTYANNLSTDGTISVGHTLIQL